MKAVLKEGRIHLKEPVPDSWAEGMELEVVQSDASTDSLEQWIAKVEASAAQMDPEDELTLDHAVRALRQQAREVARREAERRA